MLRKEFYHFDLNKNKTIKKNIIRRINCRINSDYLLSFLKRHFIFYTSEVNNYLFILKEKRKWSKPIINWRGIKHRQNRFNKFNSVEEKSEFILRDSPKYSPIDRLYNEKYIISTYIKQQELFINIYNLETNNNKTFKKDKNVSPNLPSFFSIEGKTVYAIIYPTDIGQFIDNDLITNKNILQTIKEDDNPYIIKYKLKL